METIVLPTTTGLVTEPGDWLRKAGALVVAQNVDLTAPGIIAKRRGFTNKTLNSYSGCIYSIHSSPALERNAATNVLVATGNPTSAGSTGYRFGPRDGAFTAITGGAENLVSRRAKLTTGMDGKDIVTAFGGNGQGPDVLDYTAATLQKLGVPRGMGLDRQNTTFPAGTMLTNLYSTRYAVVFVLGDPTNNGAQFGSPGMTTVVRNTSGATADVATRILLPFVYGTKGTALPADTYFVQVYRSAQQLTTAGEPPSELRLVYQKVISAADIAAGYIAFTDSVPDIARGANLYTNITTGEDGFAGRGFINSNEPPPICSDLTTWMDCVWGSELQDLPTQEVQLISVGGTGLVAADTVTVGTDVYTAVAAAPGAAQFVVTAAGTPSENQRETALNLVDAINRYTAGANNVWAYYVAGQVGQPGRIIFRTRRSQDAVAFSCSRATAFRIGTEESPATLNALAFSKPLQSHAWPAVNRFELGRGDAEVMRIIPYRDSLFVFKTDGLWRITGDSYANFAAQEFDLTFRLAARECVVAMDDAVYAWGEQGIARITDGGVEYIDLPIRTYVTSLQVTVARATFQNYSFAVGRAWDGVVAFFYPDTDGGGGVGSQNLGCGQALAYHTKTRQWATWVFSTEGDDLIGYSCGVCNVADQRMSLGVWVTSPAPGAYVHTERRELTDDDYQDPSMASAAAPSMSATAIPSAVIWSALSASGLRAAQWIRVRVDCGELYAWRQPPASLNIGMSGDLETSTSASTTTTARPQASTQVPMPYVAPVPHTRARSHALIVGITNSTISDGLNIVAVSVDFRPYSARGVGR